MKIADLELKILSVLWKLNKASSVQNLINNWPDQVEPGYTTVLKKLQVMEKKGIVGHQKNGKAYDYFPLVKKEDVSRSRFSEMLCRIFHGNKIEMVSSFLKRSDFTQEELAELKKMINRMETSRE